jgi:uncharacterized protein
VIDPSSALLTAPAIPELLLIAGLGVVGGFLTTLSGLGGGLLLVTALSALWGPHQALPVTALALLVGNLHRFALYREHLRADIARPLLLGLVPGSAIGAFLVAGLPAALLQLAMLFLVGLALARAAFGWTWRLPRLALAPAGGAVGVMAGTAGGAAVLTGPLLLASGIRGDQYMATMSLSAVAMHIARTAGYGAGGLVDPGIVAWAGFLGVSLVAGNVAGRAVRSRLGDRARAGCEHGVLAAAGLLAILGLA